jgi:hypothetical protein
VVFLVEMLTARLGAVPFFFELSKLADHAVDGVDGIGPGTHVADMDGDASHLNLEPENAYIGSDQLFVW